MTTATLEGEKIEAPEEAKARYSINIIWDDEASVWIAISDDIPLALESGSLDALIERVKVVAPEILALNSEHDTPAQFYIKSERLIAHG